MAAPALLTLCSILLLTSDLLLASADLSHLSPAPAPLLTPHKRSPSPSPSGAAPPPATNSPPAPPSPATAPTANSSVLSDINTDGGGVAEKEGGSQGMSGGKKAGIAVGVIVGGAVIGFGAVVYKKRQSNVQRSQYGYSARRELL
ncbi:hypothetical protein Scep_004932 [Stephania cephalantha]|uniref:Uncharacterized protein n=1 Tax=Stephania cephalantha TaxID=152367 RepID=A0AAP0KUR6_9MAGN